LQLRPGHRPPNKSLSAKAREFTSPPPGKRPIANHSRKAAFLFRGRTQGKENLSADCGSASNWTRLDGHRPPRDIEGVFSRLDRQSVTSHQEDEQQNRFTYRAGLHSASSNPMAITAWLAHSPQSAAGLRVALFRPVGCSSSSGPPAWQDGSRPRLAEFCLVGNFAGVARHFGVLG